MKREYNFLKATSLAALLMLFISSCERDLSEDAIFATFPNTAEVFTDVPVGLTDEFFISFDPSGGANTEGFGTDENDAYAGTTSIRIDVPASDDPDGNFIGGIFKDRGEGRNLTGYNALTFWAKGSASGTLGTVGFGTDFETDTYPVSISNLQLTTGWKKYYIPIPDPSLLTQEKGMFIFSAGGLDVVDNIPNGNEIAWTFWLDEIRFENIGTIANVQPSIMNGQDVVQETFNNVTTAVTNLEATYNLSNGMNQTVNVAPSYFEFSSSNPSVASVNGNGQVSVSTQGSATITAMLAGVLAEGSLTLNSIGNFMAAPTPTRPASNVISLFSDAYTNVPVDFYNGFFEPFQTTLGGAVNVAGDNIISYTDLNFVGIGTFINVPTINASGMSHLHLDINVQESIDPGDFIIIRPAINAGTPNETSADYVISADQLSANQWSSIDIPLSSYGIDLSNIGLLFFVSDGTISNIFVDNIYFYNE